MTADIAFPAGLVANAPAPFTRPLLVQLNKDVARVADALAVGLFPLSSHPGGRDWYPKRMLEEYKLSGYCMSQRSLSGADFQVTIQRDASGISQLSLRLGIEPSKLGEVARAAWVPSLIALATLWTTDVGRKVETPVRDKVARSVASANWVNFHCPLHSFTATDLAVSGAVLDEIITNFEPVFRDFLRERALIVRADHRAMERYGLQPPPGGALALPIIERVSVIRQLLVALHTRPLVLLAGVSGSGKSKIARYIGRAWSEFDESVFDAAQVAQESGGRVFEPYEKALVDTGSFTVDGEWCSMLLPPPETDDVMVELEPQEPPAAEGVNTTLVDDDGGTGEEADEGGTDDDGPENGGGVGVGRGPRRFAMVPVRADWQEAASLWGYADHKQRFHGTDALDVALNAWEDPGIGGYVLVLDEMNLSRLEHYGSDLLSAMECPGERMIRLHGGLPVSNGRRDIPDRIGFADRLRVIGTVNVDETTFSFAPKVLDRAAVLEFLDVDLARVCGRHRAWNLLKDWFAAVQEALEPHALHLGYRSANEILDVVHAMGADGPTHPAVDAQFRNKVLTRVRGPRGSAEPVLLALLAIARHGPTPQAAERQALLSWHQNGMLAPPTGVAVYPEAARKALHMLRRARDVGFTSFF